MAQPPVIIPVGPVPAMVTCPSCGNPIQTQVIHEVSLKTHLMALLLCFCCCWPCICVPYCVDSCKHANHYCPVCRSYVGTYRN